MIRIARNTVFFLAAVVLLSHATLATDDYPFRGLDDPAAQLDALAERCEENPSPELLTTTGWLFHLYRNDNRKAREFFRSALDSQPENAWARLGLCLIDEIEGDFDRVLSNSLVLCESSPAHPAALLALLNLQGLFGQVGHFNARVEPVLKTLLAQSRSGSIQFDEICREILSAIYRSRGDAGHLKALARERGYVTDWRIVGPFGEFANLSFLSEWQPESDTALRPRHRDGDRVRKPKQYSSRYGPIRPREAKGGLHYAETFLRSSVSQVVVLRISSHSAVELFLNNHRVYSKDTIRSYRPATESIKAPLSRGYNRLLLKFVAGGSSFSTNDSYKGLRSGCIATEAISYPSVQIFRYPGGDADFSISASRHRWQRVKQVEHSEYEPSALRYFSGLSSENPHDPLALGICGILRSVEGDVQNARRLVLAAVEHVPSYCYFNYVLGRIVEDDDSLPIQIRQSEAARRFRSALTEAGTFPLALYHTALLDIQDEKDVEAMDKLTQCAAQSPAFFPCHERLYKLYEEKEWRDEQLRQLERILGLGVETCAPYHVAEGYYRRTNQYDKLAEVVGKLQETHVYPEFLAQHYYASGWDAEAIAEYRRLKAALPEKEGVRRSLIELYERNGRWAEAEKEVKEALKLLDKKLWLWKELAELNGYRGRWRGERRSWERVLREDPVDRDARRAWQAYGQKDMLDEFDISSWDYIRSESIREKYAGVSSAIIIDQAVEEIYPNCSGRQKIHQLILLNDKKAIDRWGELDVPEDELLELRTIKRDGTVVEPERPSGSKGTISMSGLQEGDFIEFKYITRTSRSTDGPRRYLSQRFFFQSVDFPMELSQYVVIVPEDKKLELECEQVNFSRPPSVLRTRGRKVYKWEARDVPAIPQEPLAAPDTEFLPFVRVGINYDQDAEILPYQDHNVTMTKSTSEIGKATAKILADCPDDVESQTRAVYAFVNKEVRGGGGSAYLTRSASETLADRRGDRLALVKAMLDAAGIESQVIVVRANLSHDSKVFPGSFTSSLLGIRDEDRGRIRFLDFSSRYLPFGYISSALQGGSAVPLQDFSSSDFGLGGRKERLYENPFIVPRLPIADNWEERTLNASVDGDGAIEGTQVHEYTGDGAASLRDSLTTAEAYQIRDFMERMANASFRGAALTFDRVGNLSDPEKPLAIEYGFRAPNFARVVEKEMLLDKWLPLLRLGARFAALEVRQSPLQIATDFNTRFQAALKVPSGAKIVSIPSSVNLETAFGFYHLRVLELDNAVHIENEFHLKAQRISPEEYPRFADFCRAVDAAERKEIRIRLQP